MLSRLLPDIEKPGNHVRLAWERLRGLPGGPRLFSRFLGTLAPYTGSIGAQVEELAPGRSRVRLDDRRAVRNHLRSIHAVALVNLAELTGSLALAYSLPDDARFIITGISIDYVKKARGTLTATCEVEIPRSAARTEVELPVSIFDVSGELVARATIRTLTGPKRRPA
ncbi:hotdog fold domain-containing protein [Haliangium sp.]|uniref:hotdog fold domain-containing protein n=1 Tax=Haliangium sp. TaxID=2663208 RepID=UPI003D0B01B6